MKTNKLQKLLSEATEAPWEIGDIDYPNIQNGSGWVCQLWGKDEYNFLNSETNAQLICEARNTLPDLITYIKQLEDDKRELQKKRTKGEINKAYATTIERLTQENSKLKSKVNKLEQKLNKHLT